MKWVVLSDNRKVGSDLETEHGLCLYVETERHKLLLDTGGSDVFIQNANRLNIDLKQVDYVLISHGHSDHIGGLMHFLKLNTKARVVLSSAVQHERYFSKRDKWHDIGSDIDFETQSDRFFFVDEKPFILDDIQAFHNRSTKYPFPLGNRHLFQQTSTGDMVADGFDHELIFTIGTDSLLVYTGCAHLGLQNILSTVENQSSKPIDQVVGGFHLLSAKENETYETETALRNMANELQQRYPTTRFYTGHCTGDKAFETLKEVLENRLEQLHVGLKNETRINK